jgi:tetratricopeptide (TPR) repeat protein
MRQGLIVGLGVIGLSIGVGRGSSAQMAPPHHVGAEPGSPQSARLASQSAAAEIAGDSQQALRLADQALSIDGTNPWAHYDRAAALTQLGQTDQAVAAFRGAEQRFSPDDRWARSVAIYGRAHALDRARRCPEAKAAFEEYASFVERDDPRSAAMARQYAQQCAGGAPATPPNGGVGEHPSARTAPTQRP